MPRKLLLSLSLLLAIICIFVEGLFVVTDIHYLITWVLPGILKSSFSYMSQVYSEDPAILIIYLSIVLLAVIATTASIVYKRPIPHLLMLVTLITFSVTPGILLGPEYVLILPAIFLILFPFWISISDTTILIILIGPSVIALAVTWLFVYFLIKAVSPGTRASSMTSSIASEHR